ncbi:MAG: nuclear transport factor 2 family protein [Bacteroidetes bacterium]|nr:MAG: nuclear transport factor 2 family protein [Bacteroidota bacterium]
MNTKDHKQMAIDFLMLSSSGNSREAFSKYIGNNFKHHNIYFKGDGESLMIAMEENARKNPNKICDIKRFLQDGDLVATHSHVRQKPGDPGTAVVHIFRFENDKIAELWDLGQPVPLETVNENGIF